MEWTKLNFGKYIGKTLPQILFKDPCWFFDAYEYKKFQRMQDELRSEANNIYIKARNILPTDSDYKFEYFIYAYSYLQSFEIVPIDKQHPDSEGGNAFRSFFHPVLDMNFARQISRMTDVSGKDKVLYFIKNDILKLGNKHLTQKKAEDFFSNPDNFDMGREVDDWTRLCRIEEVNIPF